ncbi:hypothetical protein [Vibrio parahaemolyticus]|uniref:hypothetical protein n=1 Tax=Vibrio parahaemolyticus TaxID=670 RepID=UPI00214CB6B1|nr:hypothetical protein [Vibrio parahaemolyticus]
MFAQKKFLDWVRSADETFEKKVLELLELSPLVDSYTTSKVERLTKQKLILCALTFNLKKKARKEFPLRA